MQQSAVQPTPSPSHSQSQQLLFVCPVEAYSPRAGPFDHDTWYLPDPMPEKRPMHANGVLPQGWGPKPSLPDSVTRRTRPSCLTVSLRRRCATLTSDRLFIPCFYDMVILQQGPSYTSTNTRTGIQTGTATAPGRVQDTTTVRVWDYEVLLTSLDSDRS